MDVDKTSGTTSADKIARSGSGLTYGGILTVTKTGADTLANSDSFTLFTITSGSFSGWFSSVTLPTLASGLSWDTNKLATSGVLDVYSFTTNSVQTMSTPKNTAANLLIAKLLSKAGTSRGTVALASVSASGAQGGSVAINGSNITYTPPTSAFTGGDSFTCVLSDGHGSITATVVVTVTDPQNPAGGNGSNLAIRMEGSGVRIIVVGTPGTNYLLQYSADLSSWSSFTPAFVMPSMGVTSFDDTITYNSFTNGARYYRTILP
jgi:hypothetical protein